MHVALLQPKRVLGLQKTLSASLLWTLLANLVRSIQVRQEMQKAASDAGPKLRSAATGATDRCLTVSRSSSMSS